VAGLLFHQLVTFGLALLLSVLFAILLSAIANQLKALRIPRAIGALLGLLATLVFWIGVLALLVPPFNHEINLLARNAPSLIDSAESQIHSLTGVTPKALGDQAQAALQKLVSNPAETLGTVAVIGRGAGEAIGGLVLVSLTAYYMAVRPQPLINGVLRLIPRGRQPQAEHVFERLHRAWLGWMLGLLLDMLITGTLTYLALLVIGLQFALVLAVITALFLVVPFFGSIVSAIPAVLLALTVSPGKALAVIVIYIVIHQVEGNVIHPLIMGRAIRLHPALLAFGVVVAGALFGPLGLIVAVPLLSLAAVCVEELWMKPLEGRLAPPAQ
jgi:predicted PurR-regulated permease PerM